MTRYANVLPQLAMLDSKKDPGDTEFRYGGYNAYEYVREFGVDEYMNFDQFTRRLVVLSFCRENLVTVLCVCLTAECRDRKR